jgi:sulfotransferase family protein
MQPIRDILSRLARSTKALNQSKVGFLVAGTQKGGTTALNAYLMRHPQICTANVKEVHFFDNEWLFQSKIPRRTLYWYYHSFFAPRASHRLIGESTPIYMYWADALRRIWEYNPNMKFIIVLRNPIDRAFSHWNMERQRNADSASFYDAIRHEAERCRQASPLQHRVYSYIDRGLYAEQLRRIWRYFPPSNTLILKSEDLRTNPTIALNKVTSILDIDSFGRVEPIDVHTGRYSQALSPDERRYLQRIFEPEIRALERMLAWDCSHWLRDGDAQAHHAA